MAIRLYPYLLQALKGEALTPLHGFSTEETLISAYTVPRCEEVLEEEEEKVAGKKKKSKQEERFLFKSSKEGPRFTYTEIRRSIAHTQRNVTC